MELSDRAYLERLFEAFYEVGALPGGGVTRLGYTELEDEMHRRFAALAQELGCTGTNYTNTHGLHDPNHYTTARDLSIITRKALTYDLFREICATPEYTVQATNLSDARKLTSTNYLILNDGNRYLADNGNYYTYYLEEATGVKTGYTSAAGRCVISRASDDNMDLLCIIMGAQTRMMSDGSVRYDNFVEAKKLFNYGFSNFAYAKVAAAGIEPMFQVSVEYAKDKRGVVLIPSHDVSCLLPKEYEKEKVTTRCELNDPKGLVAPLEKGQQVGTLYISYDGVTVGSTELETLTAVEEQVVDKTISDVIGKDKSEDEKSVFQKLLGFWYVPFLVIGLLILILFLRNAVYRYRRRKALERRRRRAIVRDTREARRQQQARAPHRKDAPPQRGSSAREQTVRRGTMQDQATRRVSREELEQINRRSSGSGRGGRGGRP